MNKNTYEKWAKRFSVNSGKIVQLYIYKIQKITQSHTHIYIKIYVFIFFIKLHKYIYI